MGCNTACVKRDNKGCFVRKHSIWSPENWDDGYINVGRFKVYFPLSPMANNLGYVFRSHAVWYYNTGELINKTFIIHHIDGNKLNDEFCNLQKITQASHMTLHFKLPDVILVCKECNKEYVIPADTYNSRNKEGRRQEFCSLACYHKSRILFITFTCQECGKNFKVQRCKANSRIKAGKCPKYCSHQCSRQPKGGK